MKDSLRKITVAIAVYAIIITAAVLKGKGQERSETPQTEPDVWKEFQATAGDEFKLQFVYPFPAPEVSFSAPVAKLKVKPPNQEGEERELVFFFEITDPHLTQSIATLSENANKGSQDDASLIIEFYGDDHTFGEILAPELSSKEERSSEVYEVEGVPSRLHRQPIRARLGLKRGDQLTFGRELFALAFFDEWFVFDCHSHWFFKRYQGKLYGATDCHSFGDCRRCYCRGARSGDLSRYCWHFRLCWCYD